MEGFVISPASSRPLWLLGIICVPLALVYLTRRNGVVQLPTRDAYALLLSVEEPLRFLAALGRRGA